MATVKKGARKAAKQSVAYQSMPVAVLAAVMGGVFVLTGILLLYVSRQWRDLHAAFAMGHHQHGHWRGGVYHRFESETHA